MDEWIQTHRPFWPQSLDQKRYINKTVFSEIISCFYRILTNLLESCKKLYNKMYTTAASHTDCSIYDCSDLSTLLLYWSSKSKINKVILQKYYSKLNLHIPVKTASVRQSENETFHSEE